MRKLGFLLFGFYSYSALAQDRSPIITDRPTQSAASAVMNKGHFLVEYGFVYEDTDANVETITLANLLLRYGLLEGVEIRLTQNILRANVTIPADENTSGWSPTTLGTKVHLAEEKGWVPQMSIIGQVTLENGTEAFRPAQAIPEIRLNFSNTMSEKISLGYNLGVGFLEEETYPLYTLVMGYVFAEGWTAFAEPYGFFGDEQDHRFNAGVIYLVSDRFQLDISGGIGLSDISPSRFIGLGASLGF